MCLVYIVKAVSVNLFVRQLLELQIVIATGRK